MPDSFPVQDTGQEAGTRASARKAIHPVYLDGPLKGQDFAVTGESRFVQAIDPEGWGFRSATAPVVTYALRQFGFHSGGSAVVFWVASCGDGEPDAEVLADLLLSDAAKAARVDA